MNVRVQQNLVEENSVMLKLYDCNYSKESRSESLSGHVVLINDYTQDIQGRCDFNATLFSG